MAVATQSDSNRLHLDMLGYRHADEATSHGPDRAIVLKFILFFGNAVNFLQY